MVQTRLSWLGACFRPQVADQAPDNKGLLPGAGPQPDPATPFASSIAASGAGTAPRQGLEGQISAAPRHARWADSPIMQQQEPAVPARSARRVLNFHALDTSSNTVSYASSRASSEAGDTCSSSSSCLPHPMSQDQTAQDVLHSILNALQPICTPNPELFRRAQTEPPRLHELGDWHAVLEPTDASSHDAIPAHYDSHYSSPGFTPSPCLSSRVLHHQLTTLPRLETVLYGSTSMEPTTPTASLALHRSRDNIFLHVDSPSTPLFPAPPRAAMCTPTAAPSRCSTTSMASPFDGAPALPMIRAPTPAHSPRVLASPSPCSSPHANMLRCDEHEMTWGLESARGLEPVAVGPADLLPALCDTEASFAAMLQQVRASHVTHTTVESRPLLTTSWGSDIFAAELLTEQGCVQV